MAEPLFYSEHLADAGESLTLIGDEAHHAAASRRLSTGDRLWLFDGHGGIACATLLRIVGRGRELELRVEERRTEPRPQPAIHLACAPPKGDRQSVLLDMATQLGMTHFTPLVCERGVVKPGAGSRDRWRRLCLEACKQSRQLYLPTICSPSTPCEITAQAVAQQNTVWIAHPGAQAIPVLAAVTQTLSANVTLLVGPEGGFTEDEVKQTVAGGAKKLVLGSAILRIETAAVALLAAFILGGRRVT